MIRFSRSTFARFAARHFFVGLAFSSTYAIPAQVAAVQTETIDSETIESDTLPPEAADTVTLAGPADANEFEAWLDGYLEAYMADENVAGATVSVVRGGELFLSKGYGYADVEQRILVDPQTTLFRIGSVSKLFVWTSVMQLAERGLIDLDSDVNTYLEGVSIPSAYDEAVTLEHIMSHSAGFEDHVIGLFGDGPEDLRPLVELLSEQMPARVRPPGHVSSYSNHATGIAMLAVEQVSGVPWEQYIEDNILATLGMEHTTFGQPVPEGLVEDLSVGYSYSGGQFVAGDFEYVPLGPVGAASASAGDMARFMVAHLNLGAGESGRILSEGAALDMQSVLLRQAPGVNAMLHGFAEYSRNGEFAYGHGGDTNLFHAILVLLPDHELGFFASYNSANGNPAALFEAFMDRYFPPEPLASTTAPADFASRVASLTGSYRAARFSHTDVTKVAALAGAVEVANSGDGALVVGSGRRFVEVRPLLFREEHGTETVAFRQDERGRTTHMFLGNVPYIGFERVPTMESVGVHATLLVSAMLIFLVTVVLWPLSGFFRLRFRAEVPEGRIPTMGRLLIWVPSLLYVAFVVAMAVVLSDTFQIALGNTGALRGVLWLPVVGGFLSAAATVYAIALWLARGGTVWGRVGYTLVLIGTAAFLWQLNTFNMLGWNL